MTAAARMLVPGALAGVMLAGGPAAQAAEGFQLRYNLAGSLAGEMFTGPPARGWVASLVWSTVHIDKVTGEDGRTLTATQPGGKVPLPAPAPAALYPSYGPYLVQLEGTGNLRQWNLLVTHLSAPDLRGDRWLFGLNLPYGTRQQTSRPQAATPALNWSAAVPAPTRAAVGAQFEGQFKAALAAQGATASGEVSGLGDLELQAGWIRTAPRWRLAVGAALVLPTGRYDPAPGVDIGQGNFFTLRPTAQAVWHPRPEWSLGAKLALGFNSRNEDTQVRSGNWAGLELALARRTPWGVLGVEALHVGQWQDDSGNAFGASRLRSTSAGVFYSTGLSAIDSALSLQWAATTDSRNAKAGQFLQLRLAHRF